MVGFVHVHGILLQGIALTSENANSEGRETGLPQAGKRKSSLPNLPGTIYLSMWKVE
jgi:hypothetical protein